MRIAIIRREYITHLDGVNRFCAYLAEGLRKLGHEVFIASWSFYGVERERLPRWFAEVHGLDGEIPVYTIEEKPRRGDPWVEILFDQWFRGSGLLKELYKFLPKNLGTPLKIFETLAYERLVILPSYIPEFE